LKDRKKLRDTTAAPLFSIVIPTYNRADLLQYTIKSALNQTFDDYEIVVSNNCSIDNTRQVIAELNDGRLKCVQPESHLEVTDHWEFAFQQARGRYLIMLGDDDCIAPGTLAAFYPLVQSGKVNLISYSHGRYYHPDYFKVELRNQLQIKPFSGQLSEIDPLPQLKKWFSFDNQYFPPPSALISRQVIQTITATAKRFFFPPYPDYCAFAIVFSLGGSILHLDYPLLVFGRSTRSGGEIVFFGSGWSLDKMAFEAKKSVKWMERSDDLYQIVPLKGNYYINGYVESLLKAKSLLPSQFAGLEINQLDYFSRYYDNMLLMKDRGFDIHEDESQFRRVLSRMPVDFRQAFSQRRADASRSHGSPDFWHRIVHPFSRQVPEVVVPDNINRINGRDAGFSNAFECSRQLAAICAKLAPLGTQINSQQGKA
jgi:glycosyltransferase involved in cell wall biosynthesis